ncbi:MAG: hypothetical protein HXS54_01115 [Theionarchaea archaeon]|nr:hypothetical protein [Theionarchaea archaeon]
MRRDIPDEAFRRLHEKGLRNYQIAKELHVSDFVVSFRLGELGLINNFHNVDPSDVRKMIKAQGPGVIQASKIAQSLGISRLSVNGILDQMAKSGELP